MRRTAKTWGMALLGVMLAATVQAEAGPDATAIASVFKGLTAAEITVISAGQPVIRTAASPAKPTLAVEGALAAGMSRRFAKLNPNYYGEFLYVRRAAPGLLDALENLLSDPRHLIGLPYYSKRNATTYALFDKMELLGIARTGDTITTRVTQHMEPFADYSAAYSLARKGNELFFSFHNEGPLIYSYRNFKAAGPGDMAWELSAFEKDGWLWFYGAGGVRAFDLFGAFRGRLEDSFMGRIEAFFRFAMKSMEGEGAQ